MKEETKLCIEVVVGNITLHRICHLCHLQGISVLKIVDNVTGEIIEMNDENFELAKREFNSIQVMDDWLDRKATLDMAKEQFEMIDKPFRKKLTEIFEQYGIKRLYNDYVDVTNKNGYLKTTWDDSLVEQFIRMNGGNPDDFKKTKWVNGSLQIKVKE